MIGLHVKYIGAVCFFTLAFAVSAQAQQASVSDAQIVHLLDRISYGPAPGDIANVRSMGMGAYIEKQLYPASIPSSSDLDSRLAALQTLNAPMYQIAQAYAIPPGGKNLSQDEIKAFVQRQSIVVNELSEAKLLRAVMSPAQLQEVMTDFWFNHFNVFAEKGPDRLMISAYERDAIRPYALGKFSDLLKATAHHPAMLFYLDNWLNTDPNSSIAGGKKIGINENYARELMELHTLGVNGGYTQTDVTTLAHILTGWGLSEGKDESQKAAFYFDPRRHDFSNKLWLNYNILGNGQSEVDQVLNILAQHPSTAHHISYELAQYFVADDPPQSLVDTLTATYRSSGGDIPEMLRVIFNSHEFWDPQYAQQKFKPPFRYVVSTLRASGIVPDGDTRLLQGAIAQMGEPLYRCLTPNGYADTNDQWLNSDALLKRIDFSKRAAGFLTEGSAPTIENALGKTWSANTLTTVENAQPKLEAALLLSSPEFVYY